MLYVYLHVCIHLCRNLFWKKTVWLSISFDIHWILFWLEVWYIEHFSPWNPQNVVWRSWVTSLMFRYRKVCFNIQWWCIPCNIHFHRCVYLSFEQWPNQPITIAKEKCNELLAFAAAEGRDVRESSRATGLCPVLTELQSASSAHADS